MFHASDFSHLPEYLRDMPSARFEAALKGFTPEEVRSANEDPAEYLYPFARLLAFELNAQVQQTIFLLEHQFTFVAAVLAQTEVLEGSWAIFHDIQKDVTASLKNLKAFASPDSVGAMSLIEDYKDLLQRIEEVQQELKDYLHRHVAMVSLKESRLGVEASKRSIQQADSVNRLTKLAFAFVPLSFATSFFGMNFKELGTGQLRLWIFVVATAVLAFLVSLVTFLAFIVSKRRVKEISMS